MRTNGVYFMHSKLSDYKYHVVKWLTLICAEMGFDGSVTL